MDDDAEVLDALQCVLEDSGFEVRTASNGVRALESLRRESPGLVLLDLMMPVMSGAEMLERMRGDESLKRIPVVIASAWPEQAGAIRGAQATLRKPIDLDELIALVTRFLRAPR
ncbi:MAG TPA: response regulator [Polyangiaceae bacterium]